MNLIYLLRLCLLLCFIVYIPVLNAINRTEEHVCLIPQRMKMVYGAVRANKQADTLFQMCIFDVLCMMNSMV